MRPSMPSPAMVVALIALVVALSGTAIAAVDFATNAGAVDSKSAVSSTASLALAKGKLVATANNGPSRGRLPGRFVDDVMRGGSSAISQYLRAVDNQPGPSSRSRRSTGSGASRRSAATRIPRPNVKSTQTIITFTASQPGGVNVSRLLGRDIENARDGVVFTALPTQAVPIISLADTMFQLILQSGSKTVFMSGSARSDANRTPNAACLIWGIALRVG